MRPESIPGIERPMVELVRRFQLYLRHVRRGQLRGIGSDLAIGH